MCNCKTPCKTCSCKTGNRKQSKLARNKTELIDLTKRCLREYIKDADWTTEKELFDFIFECQLALFTINMIKRVPRTRDLDRIVYNYFGFDTVEEVLLEADSLEDDPSIAYEDN